MHMCSFRTLLACICGFAWIFHCAADPTAAPAHQTEVQEALSKLKTLPFKLNDPTNPPDVFVAKIYALGKDAIPALVSNITNTQLRADPRQMAPNKDFVIGDLAVMLLCDITKREFSDQLPESVQAEFKEIGVHAYFKYVKRPKNRENVKRNWEQWLQLQGPPEKK
jgi:hypothetical protein